MIQQGKQKALCLAAARARGHQRAQRLAVAAQAGPGLFLVAVAGKRRAKSLEEITPRLPLGKGQTNLHIGAFEPGRFVIHKAAHQAVAERIGRFEG